MDSWLNAVEGRFYHGVESVRVDIHFIQLWLDEYDTERGRRDTKAWTESRERDMYRIYFRDKCSCHWSTEGDYRSKWWKTKYETSEGTILNASLDHVDLMTEFKQESKVKKAN